MADQLIGIANHDPVLMRLMENVLTQAGFEMLRLPDGSSAYDEIKRRKPDLIVLDTWLETRDAGWVLFQALRLDTETREIPILICSSDLEGFERRAATLERHGNVDVLMKPFDIDVFVSKAREMLANVAVQPAKNDDKPEQLEVRAEFGMLEYSDSQLSLLRLTSSGTVVACVRAPLRHRRAGVVTRPVVEIGAIGIDRSLIAELRDWTVLAAVSAAAWASAAIAFGAV